MMEVGRFRLRMCFVLSLIMCVGAISSVNAAFLGLFGSGKKGSVARQSVVVFPFDQSPSAKMPDGFGVQLAAALRDQLSDSAYFAAYVFSDRMAPIQRGLVDSTLKPQTIGPPYSEDKSKSLKLAQLLGSEVFVVGAVEDFTDDTNAKTAQMTVSAELFSVKTGKLLKTFLVTGHAASADADDRMALAAGDAVVKLKSEFTDTVTAANTQTKKSSSGGKKQLSVAAPVAVEVVPAASTTSTAITQMPSFSQPLRGRNDLFVRNANKFAVKVGVRVDGRGADIHVDPNKVYTANLPDGKFEVYLTYANKPDVVVPAKGFSLKGSGAEMEITSAGDGEYNFRVIKEQ